MDEDKRYALALARIKGLRRAPLFRLLKEFTPAALFKLALSGGAGAAADPVVRAVKGFREWEWVDRELEFAEKKGARIITFNDPDYPQAFKEICDPPLLLYARGDIGLCNSALTVAVVGTRRPSHYGLKMAETVSRDLAAAGVAVVSGMARGCDAAAHRGALRAGGATVAVLGTGVDIAYPKENVRLYEEVSERGLLLSEYPMTTPPKPFNFPKRNRLISGMSRGVLVVEAPLRSGAMMTARLALDYNRDVFAVPGPATSYKSKGSNRLLKDGAGVVTEAADIFDAFGLTPAENKTVQGEEAGIMDGEEAVVFKALGEEPVFIDEIIERTGLQPSSVSALLLQMELKGMVLQRPGKTFVRSF